MDYQTIGWNECIIFPRDSQKEWGTTFFDDTAVVVAVNNTTGDCLLLNSTVERERESTGYLSNAQKIRYSEFFRADGEKTALVLGCNAGGLDANDRVKRLTEALQSQGVNIITIDPKDLPLPAGYGVGYTVRIDPADAKLTLRLDNQEIEFKTFPFGDVSITSPSQVGQIEKRAAFCAAIQNKRYWPKGGFDQYQFKNGESFTHHVEYIGSILDEHQKALPENDVDLAHLKTLFDRVLSGESGELIRADDLSTFKQSLELYAEKFGIIFGGVIDLAKREQKFSSKRAVDILVGKAEKCCTRLNQIAAQEDLDGIAGAMDQKLDELRNVRGRKIGGSSTPSKLPQPPASTSE